tara:strand:- start:2810 stop:4063 length:1254 start_codon:yes stop_codon:yes gene_type:complete
MSKFSSKERIIAKFLNRYPQLKERLKYLYQYTSYFLHKKPYTFKINTDVTLKRISKKGITSFWGYYDKSPSNKDNYCYHVLGKGTLSKRNSNRALEIHLNDNKISSTTSWNWQQGAMLTWISESEIIHNFYDGSQYKSKILNISNGKETILEQPIYSINNEKGLALTLNFNRLAKLRPDYGYFCEDFDNIPKTDPNDGVFLLDLKNNTRQLIISFEDLINFYPEQDMASAWHKVNHLDISPDGKRFMFHHRWFSDEGVKKSRLITANIDGTDLHLLANDGMVSHCTWRNNVDIVGWMTKKEFGDNYYLLKDKTAEFYPIGQGVLTEDGHPSFSADDDWMLTDTYPDKSRMSSLLLYNLSSNKVYNLGEFLSPLKFTSELRCDLHPRFNAYGNKITFDSVHEGTRGLYELDITKILSQ